MWTARFDPEAGAIYIDAQVSGPGGDVPARFLLDTGAHRTTINVSFTDDLGYGAHMANRRTRSIGAGAAIHGYTMNLRRYELMGTSLEGFEVVCEDFHAEAEIDGLVGMVFLRGRILTIDGVAGLVTLLP